MEILSKEFKEKVAEEVKIIDGDYLKATLENTSKQHHYNTLHIDHKRKLRKLEAMRVKLYGRLYNQKRFEDDLALKGASEINIYIDMDVEYAKLMKLINLKKIEIELLENIVKAFISRGFAIKNAVQLLTLER